SRCGGPAFPVQVDEPRVPGSPLPPILLWKWRGAADEGDRGPLRLLSGSVERGDEAVERGFGCSEQATVRAELGGVELRGRAGAGAELGQAGAQFLFGVLDQR